MKSQFLQSIMAVVVLAWMLPMLLIIRPQRLKEASTAMEASKIVFAASVAFRAPLVLLEKSQEEEGYPQPHPRQ